MSTVGKKVGAGLETVGDISADIRAIVGTILGVAMFVGGIVLLLRKPDWGQAKATITQANCTLTSHPSTPPAVSECIVTVAYTTEKGQKEVVRGVKLEGNHWKVGDTVEIEYSLSVPNVVRTVGLTTAQLKKLGWALVVLGPLVLIFSWLWAWAVHSSPTLGKFAGGLAALRIGSRLI